MTVKTKKAKAPSKPKPFMVYFKSLSEHESMRRAAAAFQRNPNPNLSEYARLAIRERSERDLASAK